MIFKNITFYYLLIIIPLAGLLLLTKDHRISSSVFAWGLLIYALFYHPLVSGLRLLKGGVITGSKFIRNFIPFWNLKYAGFLYLNHRPRISISRKE